MDTCPDFNPLIKDLENKTQKKDALNILKHSWGLLDKKEQKNLFWLFNMFALQQKGDMESKEELEECKKIVSSHPEVIEHLNKFYTKVVTPVKSKDHFRNDRITAAAGIEKGVKELQHKHLLKSFEIKRVA